MLALQIQDIQVEIIIKFGGAKTLNAYTKYSPKATQILNFKYIYLLYKYKM